MTDKILIFDDYMINVEDVKTNLSRICGQIFRLLPTREEGEDWIKPLETLIIELLGMSSFMRNQTKLFALCCKLQGLHEAGKDIEFAVFRRTIFEACNLVSDIKSSFE